MVNPKMNNMETQIIAPMLPLPSMEIEFENIEPNSLLHEREEDRWEASTSIDSGV